VPPIVPDYVPLHWAQGTTVKFTRSLDDFAPSDGWGYILYLNGLTQKFNKAAAQFDTAAFLIELVPADTASLAPGPYRYAERLTNPGCALVLTGVAVGPGGTAIYSYSSFSNLPPYEGMSVTITGFANGGNNVSGVISALAGGENGTFTIANGTAVNEVHVGAGAGPQEVYDISGDELVINVEPSADTSPAGAFQTFEEKTLAAIEAVIAARVSGSGPSADIEAYHIAGRAVTKMSLTELLRVRGMYRAVVWRQQHPGKLGKPWKVDFTTESEQTNYPPTWQDVTGLDSSN
jgi:hypothetical protein